MLQNRFHALCPKSENFVRIMVLSDTPLLSTVETTPPNVADSSPRSKLHISRRIYLRKIELDSTFSFPEISVRICRVSDDCSFTLHCIRVFNASSPGPFPAFQRATLKSWEWVLGTRLCDCVTDFNALHLLLYWF